MTSWMLKHRGRGWPSFPRKNRCGGLCGNQVQAPHAIASGWFPHRRWRRTALAHLVGAELVHERVVEREVRAVRVEEPLLVVVRRRQLLPPLRVGDERARREVRVGHVGHLDVPPEHGAADLGLQVALEEEHLRAEIVAYLPRGPRRSRGPCMIFAAASLRPEFDGHRVTRSRCARRRSARSRARAGPSSSPCPAAQPGRSTSARKSSADCTRHISVYCARRTSIYRRSYAARPAI